MPRKYNIFVHLGI